MVSRRSQVSVRHHQRLAGAQDGAAHVHGLAVPHGEGVPLPESRPGLTPLCENACFGPMCCFSVELLGRRGEPGHHPVRGEPERTASHHRDEEARRPQDRVSPENRALQFLRTRVARVTLVPRLTFQRVLRDDGEVGHQHQSGHQLAEPGAEHLHTDPVRSHNRRLHKGGCLRTHAFARAVVTRELNAATCRAET